MDNVIGQVVFDEQGKATLLTHYGFLTGKMVSKRGQSVAVVRIACQPSGGEVWRSSNDIRAVNCQACRMSPDFVKASVAAPAPDTDVHFVYAGKSCCGFGRQITGEVKAVSCPACKQTVAYKVAATEYRNVFPKWTG